MVILLQGAEVFAPEPLGQQDILIEGQQITYIGEVPVEAVTDLPHASVIDARGLTAVPGFIDPHVHIAGGGGEGGYANRTPEILVSDIVSAGVTTVVGCLGTDGVTRSHADLLAKARALEADGVIPHVFPGTDLSAALDEATHILISAGPDAEELLVAEIRPAVARDKHLVRIPGLHEIDRMRDRRPEFYRPIVDGTPGA